MDRCKYDFIIVGMGASGCLLLLELLRAFPHKKILLVDSSLKLQNDKTWCFWEKGSGDLDEIVFKKWENGEFYSQNVEMHFSLYPYVYKMIRSIDLYNFIRGKIQQNENVDFKTFCVRQVEEGEHGVLISDSRNSFFGNRVFDSRFDRDLEWLNEHKGVLQHFKGWFVKFEEDVLQGNSFTMMDYRFGNKNATNFMYVLPFNNKEALFEATYFSPNLVQEKIYDEEIKEYLAENYPNKRYSIQHTEKGIIPMSMYPFSSNSTSRIIKIGTAGGAVKPSSGYSFQFSRKIAKSMVQNLQKGRDTLVYKQSLKYNFYDKVFLGVLQHNNALGDEIFTQMYKKNSIQEIFSFLDEESSLFSDLKIISSFMTPKLVAKFIKEVF